MVTGKQKTKCTEWQEQFSCLCLMPGAGIIYCTLGWKYVYINFNINIIY